MISFIEGATTPIREVKTYRQYLYVTSEAREHGLDIIDMGNPDKPVKVKTWQGAFVTAHTLWIDAQRGLLFANGAYLPTMGGVGGVFVLDIKTNPREPRVIGKFDQYATDGFYVHDSYLRGNVLFAAAIFDGFVAFLDVSDLANIRRIGQFNTGCRYTHNLWPTDDGRYLFTTDERTNCPVEGWDIANPQAPVKVSQYVGAPAGTPHNVMVDGDRLLVAHYTEGVHLLDISDPARPRVMGFYDTHAGPQPHGCWGAYIFPGSDLIVASDIDGGLFVLEYTGS
jgi:choice-of-anchor B domain-containing protein